MFSFFSFQSLLSGSIQANWVYKRNDGVSISCTKIMNVVCCYKMIFSLILFDLHCKKLLLDLWIHVMLSNRQTSGLLPEGATYRNGTCMTAPECTQKGGSESSSCAGGYILILYENATIHDSHIYMLQVIYIYNVKHR